jgi:gluconate 2-dehydrogenase gamma chain
MASSPVDRRDFVLGIASAAGSGWLAAHLPALRAVAAHAASVLPQAPWEFFTPEQAREFDAISAQIVPTDETPGAREAQVVRFVDRYLATIGKGEQPGWQTAFLLLGDAVAETTPGSRSFAALSDAKQIACLTAFQRARPGLFNRFRNGTMLGMFSDPVHGGNFQKIGWKLVGFDDRYSWMPPFGYYDRA